MTDIYITSTLHSDWNLKFNPKLCKALEERGIDCYLPQRDTDQSLGPEEKSKQNLEAIRNARKLLCVAENETPNWGVEVGYAHGIGKEVIALMKVDHVVPLMVSNAVTNYVRVDDLEKIEDYIEELINYASIRRDKK